MRHKPPWQASIIFCSVGPSVPGLLMKRFTYASHATSCFSASNQWVFLNVSGAANDHDTPQATRRPPLAPICSSADISFSIIYVDCHAVFCFYSNSGHTEFPFGSTLINLSPLISCIPQAFQQGGLKTEYCIVD